MTDATGRDEDITVIGTVGLPGSGKSEATAVARETGIPVVIMGDVIRDACVDRGLDPATDHGTVARTLREENGPAAIAEASLPHIEAALEEHQTVVVDGLRSDVEVEYFQELFGEAFTLVSIEAPFEIRAERLSVRGRDADIEAGGEPLAERDERELEFGMGRAMEQADIRIENTETLSAFHERIRTVLTETAGEVRTDE